MKHISFWAKENPRKAQLSIFFLYIALNILAISGGYFFHKNGIHFENFIFDSAFVCFLTALVLYRRKAKYYFRKTLDFLLIFCTVLMIGFWGNRIDDSVPYSPFSSHTATGITIKSVAKGDTANNLNTEHKTKRKKEWRKEQNGKTKKERKKIATWLKVLLILLVVSAAIFLSYLVAILSCNLSCSGAEGLAIVVLVLGLTGAIGGGFVLIRRILGYRRRKRLDESPNPFDEE